MLKSVRYTLTLLLLVGALTACGEDTAGDTDTSETMGETSGDGETSVGETTQPDDTVMDNEPPAWEPPEILGLAPVADEDPDPDVVEVNLSAAPTQVQLAEDFELSMYSYNGQLPGALIQAKVGDEVVVHFTNDLDEPTTIHWHGLRISDQMDGNPRIQNPVQPGKTFTYRFVVPEAGTFWYHPHVRANEQVEKGLYGVLVVHDPEDPEYDAERVIVVDDILLDGDQIADFLAYHPEIMHGRYGNVLLTNGRADDVVVQGEPGQVERWRIINTANARTMSLSITGASFRVIASDGGRLSEPYETDRLQVAVGQRFDVEVAIADAGQVQVVSHVLTLNEQDEVVEIGIPVWTLEVPTSAEAPAWPEWTPMEMPRPSFDMITEEMTFNAYQTPLGEVQWTINGEAFREEPLFTFAQGDVVRLRLTNDAGPEHPFHLHGQFFTIVDQGTTETRQPGFKDTVLVPGFSTVEVIAYMDNPGRWMAHCHILEHAELGMMSEIVVTPAGE